MDTDVLHVEADETIAQRYLLEKRLGGGKDGECWLARDQHADRVVACKVAFFSSHHAHEIFWTQYNRLLALRLPQLVAPLDYTVHEVEGRRHPVVAMEFLDGPTFDAWAKNASERGRVESVATIATTLLAIHTSGATHGDLFEGNIVMVQNMPVLIDPEATTWGSVSTRDQEQGGDHEGLATLIEKYCAKALLPRAARLAAALRDGVPNALEDAAVALSSSLTWEVLSQNSRLRHETGGEAFRKNLDERTELRRQIVRARHAAMGDLVERINDLGDSYGISAEIASRRDGLSHDLEVVGNGFGEVSTIAIQCKCAGDPKFHWQFEMEDVRGFGWWPYGERCVGAIKSHAHRNKKPENLYVYLGEGGDYTLTRRQQPDAPPGEVMFDSNPRRRDVPVRDKEVPLEDTWVANRIRQLVGLEPLVEEGPPVIGDGDRGQVDDGG